MEKFDIHTARSLDVASLNDKLPAWLQAAWADASDIQLANIKPPSAGFSNETWLLDIACTRAAQKVVIPAVLRIEQTQAATYPDYDLALQYKIMELLAGSPVPVPRVLGFCADTDVLGRRFYLMERVTGRIMEENPPYNIQGWVVQLPADAQRALWLSAVESYAELAKVPMDSRFDFLALKDAGSTHLQKQLSYLARFIQWAESLNKPYPALWAAHAWLTANQPQNEPTAVCWGDSKIANNIFAADENRVAAALDWEGALLGNPVQDLAWMWTLDRAMSEGYGLPRVAGFADKADTLSHWEKISGHSARDFAYYEVLAALKFAVIMARIGTIMTQAGMVPPEAQMDVRNGGMAVLARLGAERGFLPAQ